MTGLFELLSNKHQVPAQYQAWGDAGTMKRPSICLRELMDSFLWQKSAYRVCELNFQVEMSVDT